MWYFSWILGVTMAVLLAIVNTMMCDAREYSSKQEDETKS